jgi:hypothetical protein
MAAPCGRLGTCWVHSRNAGCEERLAGSLKPQFPQRLHSPVRAPGRTAFWACKPIWTGFPETGPSRVRAMRLRIGCSISMSALIHGDMALV